MSCGGARGQPILWGRSGVSPFLWGGQGSACPVGWSRVSPSCGGGHGEIRGQPVLWGGQGSTCPVGVWGQPILWGGQGSARPVGRSGVNPSCGGQGSARPVGAQGQRGPWHWERLSCPSCVAPRLRSAPWRPLGGPSSSPAFHLGTLMAGSSPQDTFLQLLVSERPSMHACPRGVWKGGPHVLSLPHFNQGFQQVSVLLTFHCLRNNTSEHSGKVQTIIIRRQQKMWVLSPPPNSSPLPRMRCGQWFHVWFHE